MISTLIRFPRVVLCVSLTCYFVIAIVALTLGFVRLDPVGDRDFIIDSPTDMRVRNYEALSAAKKTPQFTIPPMFEMSKTKLH